MNTDLLLTVFREKKHLFALVDAARTFGLPKFLAGQPAPGQPTRLEARGLIQCLYDGKSARDLRDFAPYLVEIGGETALLKSLLEKGWGQAWGLWFSCPLPFAEVRRHLRRLLVVKVEGGADMFFRFYDPRVLRVYLPTCTEAERKDVFGPITEFFLEDEEPSTCLVLTNGPRGLLTERRPVVRNQLYNSPFGYTRL
jgi:hypothetical protein